MYTYIYICIHRSIYLVPSLRRWFKFPFPWFIVSWMTQSLLLSQFPYRWRIKDSEAPLLVPCIHGDLEKHCFIKIVTVNPVKKQSQSLHWTTHWDGDPILPSSRFRVCSCRPPRPQMLFIVSTSGYQYKGSHGFDRQSVALLQFLTSKKFAGKNPYLHIFTPCTNQTRRHFGLQVACKWETKWWQSISRSPESLCNCGITDIISTQNKRLHMGATSSSWAIPATTLSGIGKKFFVSLFQFLANSFLTKNLCLYPSLFFTIPFFKSISPSDE